MKLRKPFKITKPDYDIAIKRLHLYYDMKLVKFGIKKEKKFDSSFSNFQTTIHTTTTCFISN